MSIFSIFAGLNPAIIYYLSLPIGFAVKRFMELRFGSYFKKGETDDMMKRFIPLSFIAITIIAVLVNFCHVHDRSIFVDKNWYFTVMEAQLTDHSLILILTLLCFAAFSYVSATKDKIHFLIGRNMILASAVGVLFSKDGFVALFYDEILVLSVIFLICIDKKIEKIKAFQYSFIHILAGSMIMLGLISYSYSGDEVMKFGMQYKKYSWLILIGVMAIMSAPPFSFLSFNVYAKASYGNLPFVAPVGSKIFFWSIFPFLKYVNSGHLFAISIFIIVVLSIRSILERNYVKSIMAIMIMNGGVIMMLTSFSHGIILQDITVYTAVFVFTYFHAFKNVEIIKTMQKKPGAVLFSDIAVVSASKSLIFKMSFWISSLSVACLPFSLMGMAEDAILKNSYSFYLYKPALILARSAMLVFIVKSFLYYTQGKSYVKSVKKINSEDTRSSWMVFLFHLAFNMLMLFIEYRNDNLISVHHCINFLISLTSVSLVFMFFGKNIKSGISVDDDVFFTLSKYILKIGLGTIITIVDFMGLLSNLFLSIFTKIRKLLAIAIRNSSMDSFSKAYSAEFVFSMLLAMAAFLILLCI